MSRRASALVAGALTGGLTVALAATGYGGWALSQVALATMPGEAGSPEPEVVVTLRDEAIDESSGVVVRGDRLFTVNDSGDGPHVYEVDLRSGETLGVTTYADDDPEDVEALAQGTDDALWVGDVGDNRRSRSTIEVYRVVPVPGGGQVPATRYELEYPDRPHDAETLLVHPQTGRLYVVTKSFTRGGTVYRAPHRLRPGEPQILEQVATVPGMVTDGTFLPGGRRVLLRTYGSAAVYAYPGFEPLASVPLPGQEQGEAVAVARDGRVYLTSEGERSDVLVMDLPQLPAAGSRGPGGAAGGPSGAPGDPEAAEQSTEPSSRYDPQPWMGLGPAGLLLAVLGSASVLLVLRAVLRRSRRRQ